MPSPVIVALDFDSLSDAKAIYKAEYWDPIGGDNLPAALQVTALDAAVNQGVANAKKWLSQSGGDPAKFNALRRGQYEHLASSNPGKYGKFLKAWEARVPSDTQTALAKLGSRRVSLNKQCLVPAGLRLIQTHHCRVSFGPRDAPQRMIAADILVAFEIEGFGTRVHDICD